MIFQYLYKLSVMSNKNNFRYTLKTLLCVGLTFLPIYIHAGDFEKKLPNNNPFWESSLGIQQIERIIADLNSSMGNIPPQVLKIAIYQIRSNPDEFSSGLAGYIQAKIETAFRAEGRRQVVSPPELKTLTITSTDTSFELSNTIPTLGELWKLGDQLRIDAFVQGNLSKTDDGDVLLNLKLIAHRTAEVLWSGDFIAGPNRPKPSIFDLRWSVGIPMRVQPVDKVELTVDGDPGDSIQFKQLSRLSFRVECSEALLENKRFWYNVFAGPDVSLVPAESADKNRLHRIYGMHLGVGALVVVLNKANPDRGYWLATYVSGEVYKPFSFNGTILTTTVGYKAQLSQHFALSAGISFLPAGRVIEGTGLLPNTDIGEATFAAYSFEFNLLNYSF